ncbi:MAG: hypothetical protein ACI4KG_07375 [Oscillospiraceae bacterium]
MEAKPGMIVRSLAGRDKGRFLAVVSASEGFVFLADGKERKLASPKKKNEKHIAPTKTVIDISNLTDRGLRTALQKFQSGEEA